MDIFNNKKRYIKCIDKRDTNPYPCEYELLEVGKVYTVTHIEVYGWHTMITLAEIPGKEFNSVLFDEIEEGE